MASAIDLERLKALGELVSLPLVAAAAIVGVIGYLTDLQEQKRQYTFTVVQQYHAGDLARARLDMFGRMTELQQSYGDVRLGAVDLGTILAKSLDADPGRFGTLSDSVVMIADFFNSAADCARAELCDPVLLEQLLKDEAQTFACVFGPTVALIGRRAHVGGLLAGAEAIGGGCGDD